MKNKAGLIILSLRKDSFDQLNLTFLYPLGCSMYREESLRGHRIAAINEKLVNRGSGRSSCRAVGDYAAHL